MKTLKSLIKRNTILFFKDKGVFFSSLITPMILLVLYATFLGNVYKDSFISTVPEFIKLDDKLIDGYVTAQLISSILAVSAITVTFCSNMIMVQDKANKTITDFTVSPIKPSLLALGYYISTLISTLIVCYTALALCLVYTAFSGWYLTFTDIILLIGDVFLLVMFGTALSSIINFFLSSQGQISAVGTIVSSCYGFICGAYMPISQFPKALQKVISFLPGTYGTSLLKNHAMRGVFCELEKEGFAGEALSSMKKVLDCELYFFERSVSITAMLFIVIISVAVLLSLYILLNIIGIKKARKD